MANEAGASVVRRLLFLVAGTLLVSFLACRGILGIEDLPSGVGDSAPSLDAPSDAGSPFSVVNGVPAGESLASVFGWDKNNFVAVGTSELSYVYQSGTFQRLGGTAAGRDYNAVWGRSPTDVFAVGSVAEPYGGFISHFDGVAWTTTFETPAPLFGVWGTEQGVLAVGEQGAVYGWKPGGMWQAIEQLPPNPDVPSSANAPRLWAVSGHTLEDFTIAGDGDRFVHWEPDAGGLAYYEPTLPLQTAFTSVWQAATPETNVYLGSTFFGLYWFTAPGTPTDASVLGPGTGYQMVQLFTDNSPGAENRSVLGIWGTASKVVAVGDVGRIYVYDVLQQNVSVVPTPSTDQVFGGVWGSALDDVWVVGQDELILHGSL